LFQRLADNVSRSIALKGLLFVQTEPTSKARAAHRVHDKIQSVARQAADPSWLIKETPPQLRPSAKRTIQNLLKQIARDSQQVSSARRYLVTTLSRSPAEPLDVATILERVDGQSEPEHILEELIQLQRSKALRLTIEYGEGNG